MLEQSDSGGARRPWKVLSGVAIGIVTLVVLWAAASVAHGSAPAPATVTQFGSGPVQGFPTPTTLSSPSLETGELFGSSVAVSGPYVVVGAQHERADGDSQAGHAWIFDTKTGKVTKLTSPNPVAFGDFGYSVAVSGSTVLVGAPYETVSGNNGAGHAYTFNATTGDLISSFSSPSIESGEAFGYSVAISGSTVVIGAPFETADGFLSAGHAWIFNTVSGKSIKLTSSVPQTEGFFGFSVAVDASTVVVGAPAESSAGFTTAGNVYTFVASSGSLRASFGSGDPTSGGAFGRSVAIHGETVAVGAPGEQVVSNVGAGHAYTVNALTGLILAEYTSPSIESNESFGFSVTINATALFVGAPDETALGHSEAGHAWSFVTKTGVATDLTSPNAQTDGAFGWCVAADVTTAVVGAPFETVSGTNDAGHAYEY